MENYGWLGEGLFSGAILGLAVWQWLSIRRVISRRRERERREPMRGPPDAL